MWIQSWNSKKERKEPIPILSNQDTWSFLQRTALNNVNSYLKNCNGNAAVDYRIDKEKKQIVVHYINNDLTEYYIVTENIDYYLTT